MADTNDMTGGRKPLRDLAARLPNLDEPPAWVDDNGLVITSLSVVTDDSVITIQPFEGASYGKLYADAISIADKSGGMVCWIVGVTYEEVTT